MEILTSTYTIKIQAHSITEKPQIDLDYLISVIKEKMEQEYHYGIDIIVDSYDSTKGDI